MSWSKKKGGDKTGGGLNTSLQKSEFIKAKEKKKEAKRLYYRKLFSF